MPSTNNVYHLVTGSFNYLNAINVETFNSLRLRFGINAVQARLRVGIDRVRVTATCENQNDRTLGKSI